jgi:uncharacterized protein YkwD
LKWKKGFLMKRMSLFLTSLVLILTLIDNPAWSRNTPSESWRQANEALSANDLDQALSLYKKILLYCERTDNLSGKVDALEAIALVYKKRGDYFLARHYCHKSLRTGSATYRTYYLLTEIEYEDGKNYEAAQDYCEAGLQKFPQNRQLLSYQTLLNGQNIRQFASTKINVLNTGGKSDQVDFLTLLELEIVEEMNLARQNPAAYVRHLVKLRKYYTEDLLQFPGKTPVRTQEGVKAVDEAIRYLKSTKPIPKLKISKGLSRAARDHVNDQSRSGKTGHIGDDGSKPYERMERYGSWEGLSGENISYGDESARMIVMQLIIDDGVPARGHRENIFSREFRYTGVAVGGHPIYRTMCVIDYAGEFTEKKAARK